MWLSVSWHFCVWSCLMYYCFVLYVLYGTLITSMGKRKLVDLLLVLLLSMYYLSLLVYASSW